jgi:hypothetical protein
MVRYVYFKPYFRARCITRSYMTAQTFHQSPARSTTDTLNLRAGHEHIRLARRDRGTLSVL